MCLSRNRQPVLWLLVACLLAVRALVPSGWMPVAEDDGIRIALCTGQGTVMARLDDQGRLHRDGAPDNAPRETCPYATVTAPFDVPAGPVIAAASAAPVLVNRPSLTAALIAARKSLRPPARGPPAFA